MEAVGDEGRDSPAFKLAARKELAFLKSLLPGKNHKPRKGKSNVPI